MHTIERFQIVPATQSGVVARLLFAAEVVVIALLATGFAVEGAITAGLMVALGLLVAYTAALARVRLRGMAVSCNCFGASPRSVSWYDVVRNLILAGTSIAGLVVAPVTLSTMDALALVVVAAGAALVVANLANVVETVVKPE